VFFLPYIDYGPPITVHAPYVGLRRADMPGVRIWLRVGAQAQLYSTRGRSKSALLVYHDGTGQQQVPVACTIAQAERAFSRVQQLIEELDLDYQETDLPALLRMPEAYEWFNSTTNPTALAAARFGSVEHARRFVEQLYAVGARYVGMVVFPPEPDGPYADALQIVLPANEVESRLLWQLLYREQREGGATIEADCRPHTFRLWWDFGKA